MKSFNKDFFNQIFIIFVILLRNETMFTNLFMKLKYSQLEIPT